MEEKSKHKKKDKKRDSRKKHYSDQKKPKTRDERLRSPLKSPLNARWRQEGKDGGAPESSPTVTPHISGEEPIVHRFTSPQFSRQISPRGARPPEVHVHPTDGNVARSINVSGRNPSPSSMHTHDKFPKLPPPPMPHTAGDSLAAPQPARPVGSTHSPMPSPKRVSAPPSHAVSMQQQAVQGGEGPTGGTLSPPSPRTKNAAAPAAVQGGKGPVGEGTLPPSPRANNAAASAAVQGGKGPMGGGTLPPLPRTNNVAASSALSPRPPPNAHIAFQSSHDISTKVLLHKRDIVCAAVTERLVEMVEQNKGLELNIMELHIKLEKKMSESDALIAKKAQLEPLLGQRDALELEIRNLEEMIAARSK